MTSRSVVPLLFVITNIVIFTGYIIFVSFQIYPDQVAFVYSRADKLQKIYNNIRELQRKENISPEEVNSLLRYDTNEAKVFLGQKELGYYPYYTGHWGENGHFRYYLIDGEPVIVDLGENEGGMDWDMDVTYPEKYQKLPSFNQFLETNYFKKALLIAFIFSTVISLCLYAMWRKNSPALRISVNSIVLSVVFVFFELFCAQLIVFGHVYPTH